MTEKGIPYGLSGRRRDAPQIQTGRPVGDNDSAGAVGEEGRPRLWGYARVSTVDQNPEVQFDALRRAGVTDEQIVTEYASGGRQDRPALAALMGRLQAGDVLIVWKLDRLGRSVSHLVNLVD